jgi:hypothetical protein
MYIECSCGAKYQAKTAPCPDKDYLGTCLVAHYAEDAYVCPSCAKDNPPKLSDGIRIEIGEGQYNLGFLTWDQTLQVVGVPLPRVLE